MKIGIFGGTFNPVHIGHLRPVEEVREFFNLDKVLFVIAKNPPHKHLNKILNAEIRYKILKLALEDNPYFFPSDIELKRDGKSYTFETILELKNLYINDDIILIIGKDSFYEITTWYKWEDILNSVDIIVLNRKISEKTYDKENYLKLLGYQKISEYQYLNLQTERKIILFDNSIIEISSSKIRENFKNKLSNKYLIPEKALNFIINHSFY